MGRGGPEAPLARETEPSQLEVLRYGGVFPFL